MNKHTPEPWELDEYPLSIDIVSAKGPIAVVGSRYCDSPEEMKANAKLIAAAPEMYEALKKLVSAIIFYGAVDEGGDDYFPWPEIENVKEIIERIEK